MVDYEMSNGSIATCPQPTTGRTNTKFVGMVRDYLTHLKIQMQLVDRLIGLPVPRTSLETNRGPSVEYRCPFDQAEEMGMGAVGSIEMLRRAQEAEQMYPSDDGIKPGEGADSDEDEAEAPLSMESDEEEASEAPSPKVPDRPRRKSSLLRKGTKQHC